MIKALQLDLLPRHRASLSQVYNMHIMHAVDLSPTSRSSEHPQKRQLLSKRLDQVQPVDASLGSETEIAGSDANGGEGSLESLMGGVHNPLSRG